MKRPTCCLVLLTALLAAPSRADDFTVLTEAVVGEVRVAGVDRLAGGVRIDLFGRGDEPAVSGRDGQFRWPIRPGSNVTAGPPGEAGPTCRASSYDARQWTLEFVLDQAGSKQYVQGLVDQQITEVAATRWSVRDGKP